MTKFTHLVVGGVTLAACAATIPLATIEPLRPGELAGSAWTVMSPLDLRVSGQRIVLDGTTVQSVLVPVVSANPGDLDASVVTMRLVAESGAVLARVQQLLPTGADGWVRFPLPDAGVTLPAGTVAVLWMANAEREVFGWRYQTNTARAGGAYLLGKSEPQWDFLYRLESATGVLTGTASDTPAATRVTTPSPVPGTPRLIAHYPLTSDLRDVTGNHGPLQTDNAPIDPSRGLFCGGPRAIAGSQSCNVRTPPLPTELGSQFTIRAQFLVPESLPIHSPVFVGGPRNRWVAYDLQPDGSIRLIYSNSLRETCSVRYRTGTWHEAAITYDGRTIRLFLDNRLGCEVNAPLNIGTDTVVLLNNPADASAFYGFLRDLRVYAGLAP